MHGGKSAMAGVDHGVDAGACAGIEEIDHDDLTLQ